MNGQREYRSGQTKAAFCFLLSSVCLLFTVSGLLPLILWAHDGSGGASRKNLDTALTFDSKIRILSGDEVEQGTSFKPIVITESEANSYFKEHAQEFLPPGVGDLALRITPDRVFGSAVVDFEEFARSAKSGDWGPRVLAAMFKGKQKVTAAGKLETQNGQGKVKIETLNVGTFVVPDWMVDFLMENYLQPRYKTDFTKPFVLPDHVTRIELGLGQATFVRSSQKQEILGTNR